jgi:hypothetical protein
MAKQTISLGTVANDGTGDPARTAFDKANDNFDELYAGTNPDLTTQNAMGALAVDTSKRVNTKTISADSTLTFNTAPAAGTRFSLLLTNSDADFGKTITIPSSYSLLRRAAATTVLAPNNATIRLTWFYTGSAYILEEEPIGVLASAGQFSFVLGRGAGTSAAGDFNTLVGVGAGSAVPADGETVAVGYNAGVNAGGYAGTFVGFTAGQSGGGTSAVGIGYESLKNADGSGTGNVAVGVHAAQSLTTMSGSIVIGYHTANGVTSCQGSVVIGNRAANSAFADINNCVFIGPYAGVDRANTLWIEGQGSAIASHIPLIYGQFDNDAAAINGSLRCGTATASTVAIASAALEVVSTSKAFYPPRMTKAQRDLISSPGVGATVYQTDNTPGQRVFNGTNWMRYTETADA